MLMSMNALERFTQTNSNRKSSTVFNDKDSNHLGNTKQNSKKRSFKEIASVSGAPTSKAKRVSKNLMENPTISKLKQLQKNRLRAITTGIHPTLKKAKDEISKLSMKLKKVQQQSTFWREKTLNLQKQLRSSKSSAADLSERVVKLEVERVLLQKKVTAAEEQSNALADSMRKLIAENKELKETVNHMDEELKALMEDDAKSQVRDCPEHMLEKALEDTLADLSDRLAEIEDLKKLLAKVAIEKNLLEKEVAKKQIIAEIVDLNEGEAEYGNTDGKISKLQNAVEKCMFRIAVLTQKNEELRKNSHNMSFSSDQDARMMDLLEDEEKLHLLESVCMKRFRKVLKMAGEELVIQEAVNEPST